MPTPSLLDSAAWDSYGLTTFVIFMVVLHLVVFVGIRVLCCAVLLACYCEMCAVILGENECAPVELYA
jgi:hypothetical protein